MGKLKICLLLSYICIASISVAIITPALPQIESFFVLTHGLVEWVISIFLLGYVIGQLVYGPLANRFGRLSALRSGLVINILGIILCIISVWFTSYNLMLLGRLITALGSAAGLSCTFMLVNELLSKEQAKQAMSFTIVSFTIGIGLAVTVGGILTQYLGWQYCFGILLVHGILMLLFTWQFPETLINPVELHPLIILSRYSQALKNSNLIIYSLVVGLVSAVSYCYSAAAPIYAQSVLNLSPDLYAYWNFFNISGMLLSGYLSSYLMKKYSAEKVLLLGLCLLAPCLLSLLLIATLGQAIPFWFFVTTMLLYLFSGILFPAGSYLASNAITDKGISSSMMSFINMGSAMSAVIVMGYLPLSTIMAFTVTLLLFYIVVSALALLK